MCTASGIRPALVYLYGPICLSSIANISFFVLTAIALRRTNKDAAFAASNKIKAKKQKYIVHMMRFIYTGKWMVVIYGFF